MIFNYEKFEKTGKVEEKLIVQETIVDDESALYKRRKDSALTTDPNLNLTSKFIKEVNVVIKTK